jgi:ABC-2 family transporter protein
MNAIARMAVLDMRTVAPYRNRQSLVLLVIVIALMANKPAALIPALVLLVTPTIAAYPFLIADKSDLETLYAVLPVPRRSVLYGHYVWALTSFLATVAVGTALAVTFAQVWGPPLSGHTLETILALSWGLYAVDISIQLPLLIRFGYTRIGLWGITAPLALAADAVVRFHISLTSLDRWLPVVWLIGVAVVAASAAVAPVVDRHFSTAKAPSAPVT